MTRSILLLALTLGACAATPPLTRSSCEAVLKEQAAQWNRGDLRAFVDTYWPGDELTFLGSRGLTRGQEDLLENYERGYPTQQARGVLSFEVIDFQPLGEEYALLLGRYEIERAEPDAGFFSLVLRRNGETIRILHDHTSREATDG